MKKITSNFLLHEKSNDTMIKILDSVPGVKYVSKLDDVLKERGLSQQQLAEITGLRAGTITELVKGNKTSTSKTHIITVMIALRITDIRDLFDIEFDQETKERFDKEREKWVKENTIPQEILNLYSENTKSATPLLNNNK
ncbi:helix-turn-helix domain-containing protein [Clostridium ljungdahlii]|uniref:Helix-turn-helix protein n=1 Tax=Clostridium ljungdahlii TaxID=1538 RepID=A0A166RKU7_9CLOT|nr:helix-turn-helix transcriptional regulator [Clostridium ljungdahlii]OAA90883.1 helix-turn-helix protein [Clostridium ljungdahlii]